MSIQVARVRRTTPYWIEAALACSVLVAASACASNTARLEPLEPAPALTATPMQFEGSEGVTVTGTEIKVAGTVTAADYNPRTRTALVRFTPRGRRSSNDGTLALFDLDSRSVRWAYRGDAAIEVLDDSVVILRSGRTSKLFDASTGQFLRDGEPWLMVLGADTAVVLDPKYAARVNLRSGNPVWRAEGLDWVGYHQRVRNGDWTYVVANGLRAFHIEDGSGWFHRTSTSHKGVAEALVTDFALGMLAALAGARNYGRSSPRLTHNINALPLPVAGAVYFAARNKVYAFEASSGELRWEAMLERVPGSMELSPFGDERIALVGRGWVYVDFARTPAAPPSVTLFDANTGQQLAAFHLPERNVAMDFRASEEAAVLLTPAHLYRLDPDLALLGQLAATPADGFFVRVLQDADPLIVRTSRGVLALSPATLERLWFAELGQSCVVQPPKRGELAELVQLAAHDRDAARSMLDGEIVWLPASGGITAVSLTRQGEAALHIPWPDCMYTISDGNLIAAADDRIAIVPLHVTRD